MSGEAHNFKVGDEIELGEWPFDRRGNVKKIEWVIIDKHDDGTCLLMTKYGIETKKFNEKSGDVSWETCDLRKWLNGDFYSQAFSEKEKESIMLVTMETECRSGFLGGLFGSKKRETKDNVFLLAVDQAEMLFGNESRRKAKASLWAIQNLAFADSEHGICWWWLRSPGKKHGCAACVCEGTVNHDGVKTDYASNCVRPVIKLSLFDYENLMKEQENLQ